MRSLRYVAAAALALGLTAATASADGPVPDPTRPASTAPTVHVKGNKLVDATGKPLLLHGVNRSGAEFVCHVDTPTGKVFDGPTDDASIAAIAAWKGVNTVRLPLNEDCWLGLKGADPTAAGLVYQRQVRDYVDRLHAHGLVVILDLHWTDGQDTGKYILCKEPEAGCQKSMPDIAHAPAFWRSVAKVFRDDRSTLFDVFNEPFVDMGHDLKPGVAWRCWRDGGSACPNIGFRPAGMQSLIDAVRSTGARNVILLGGLSYAHDLSLYLKHRPVDPMDGLAVSWHTYNFNFCVDVKCWDSSVAPVAKVLPMVTTEIGQDDCKGDYVNKVMPWLDRHGIGYLAWTWNTYSDCAKSPILIKDYDGTPTAYGKAVKDHLASLRR